MAHRRILGPADHRHSGGEEEQRVRAAHPLLELQAAAGNRAVASLLEPRALPLQRQLEVTGAPADVSAMLGMLSPASGLKLTQDSKTGLVTSAGAAGKPKSAELAARLAGIIADAGKKAQIHLGRTQVATSFGAFPGDLSKPVQELRIDQFLALEKGVPGDGVAKLIHEITENYEGHGVLDQRSDIVFTGLHEKAIVAENAVLGELQVSAGQAPSGDRWNTFSYVLPTPAPGGKGRPAGRPPAAQTLRTIEAHANDFVVREQDFDDHTNQLRSARRAPAVQVAQYTLAGFGPTTGLPAGVAGDIAKIGAAVSADRSISVLFQVAANRAAQSAAADWADLVWDAVGAPITDVEIKTWQRKWALPVQSGSSNTVTVTLRRPQL